MSIQEPQRWSAAFSSSDRYTPPKDTDTLTATVRVDGEQCPATVLGRNGPRVQARFVRDGKAFVRWFDAVDVSSSSD